MPHALLEELKRTERLPSAPGIALRVVELAQRDDVGLDDLTVLLRQDPALVAKIIRTANSSMFGMPREVSNVNQAVMILGMRSVNMLALSFSLTSGMASGSNALFDYRRFWTTTAASAIAARSLAERCRPAFRDEAFLGGLLSDIGQVVLVEAASEAYAPVLEALEDTEDALHLVEERVLGLTHMDVAGDLLDAWGLPFDVCHAIGAHHDPFILEAQGGNAFALAKILHVANTCGELFAGAHVEASAEHARNLAELYFDLPASDYGALLGQIGDQLPEMANLLELEVNDPEELLRIKTTAMELLVQETVALDQQVHNVTSEVGRLQMVNEELQEKATKDPLTGLGNRGHFDEQLAKLFDECISRGHTMGLLMIDVDHFKSVNDEYGHPVGDELLREIGRVIAEVVGRDELGCRYGGEEFAVVCPAISRADLNNRAETIRGRIGALDLELEGGKKLHRTASIGACWAERPTGGLPGRLIEVADQALYRAKSGGRDRVEMYNLP